MSKHSKHNAIRGTRHSDVLSGGKANDKIMGKKGDDILNGEGGNDRLFGGRGDDILNGGGGNDKLRGGKGDDTYILSEGNDVIRDGKGVDRLVVDSGLTFNDLTFSKSSNGHDLIIEFGDGNKTTIKNQFHNKPIETLEFDDGRVFDLTHFDNLINYDPLDDDNIIPGTDAVDIVDSGAGDDTVDGGSGNDTLNGGSGDDILNGGTDDDILNGDDGFDTLGGGDGNDTLNGGNNIDKLYGGNGDDILNGGAGYDRLWGGTGTDTFVFDTITDYDSTGHDLVYDFNPTEDILDISALLGDFDPAVHNIYDFVSFASDAERSFIFIDADGAGSAAASQTIVRINSVEISEFTFQDLVLKGNIKITDESIDLFAMFTQNGTVGDDSIKGDATNNIIDGGAGYDVLYGYLGNDILNGGSEIDTLYGDEGDDILNGGSGYDRLHGGEGVDTFVFDTITDYDSTGHDLVYDFNPNEDKLDISDLLSGYNAETDNIFDFVSFASDSTRSYIFIDADGTGDAATSQTIVRLNNVVMNEENFEQLVNDATVII